VKFRLPLTGDAHMLADIVRADSHQLCAVAGDTAWARAVKVVTARSPGPRARRRPSPPGSVAPVTEGTCQMRAIRTRPKVVVSFDGGVVGRTGRHALCLRSAAEPCAL